MQSSPTSSHQQEPPSAHPLASVHALVAPPAAAPTATAASSSNLPIVETPATPSARSTPSSTKKRGCNCKKSGCLKLYCECFAANMRCGERCQCINCRNKEHNHLEIAYAIQMIEKRTQKAFRSSPAPAAAAVAQTLEHFRDLSMPTALATDALLLAPSIDNSIATRAALIAPYESQRESHRQATPKLKGCSCKKSNCLKLYCECLAAKRECSARCHCNGCKNCPEHQTERDRAVATILDRNPQAFEPKVARGASQHLRGCNCRKSGCMKNYCECHQAGVACTARCACRQCRNTEPLVAAKKTLLYQTHDDAASKSKSNSKSNGKRAYRKASYDVSQDAPYTPSRQAHPNPSAALELLSRSAPPAVRRTSAIATTPSKRDITGTSVRYEHDNHSNSNNNGPLFAKRKASRTSARPLFLDSVVESAAHDHKHNHADRPLPSIDAIIAHDFAVADDATSETPVVKLCRSLLLAAQTVDAASAAAATSPIASTLLSPTPPPVENSNTSRRASESSDVAMSPRSDDLLCAEDMETTPSDKATTAAAAANAAHAFSSRNRNDRYVAAQERAVLQEVTVWMRNVTAAALAHRSQQQQQQQR